jgi:hypothetical protein
MLTVLADRPDRVVTGDPEVVGGGVGQSLLDPLQLSLGNNWINTLALAKWIVVIGVTRQQNGVNEDDLEGLDGTCPGRDEEEGMRDKSGWVIEQTTHLATVTKETTRS